MKIFYVVNDAAFFISHRLPLAEHARKLGHAVTIVTAPDTGEARFAELGFDVRTVPMSRSGFNVFSERKTFQALCDLYAAEQPDLVHHVTIKPVIYGSFAARRAGIKSVVNAVPGMGFVFTRRGYLAGVVRAAVNTMYRWAFAHGNMRVIFQNTEDMQGFLGHAIVSREQAVLIRGSGVEVNDFDPTPCSDPTPVFLLAARMLRDKGVLEFAKAAHNLRRQHPNWQFWIAGGEDPGNPTSISADELRRLEARFGVKWLGHVDDMSALLKQVHVVCLPTYYREGLPKTLLDGSAAGRALIASDIAGCREVVTPGVNGLLVTPREVISLSRAMLALGEDEALRNRLGAAARRRAEAIFSVQDVVEHTFRVYDELQTEPASEPVGAGV